MIQYLNPKANYYPQMLETIKRVYTSGVGKNAVYTERNAIQTGKMQAWMNNERTASSQLIEDLHLSYPDADTPFSPFPNYRFRIPMPSRQDGLVRRHRDFQIFVSLLAEFYTCFWEDRYEMLEFRDDETFISPNVLITSFSKIIMKYPDCQAMMETTQSLMARHFPSHRFVNHYGLFTSDAEHDAALPTCEHKEPPHKYFDYLFDDSLLQFNRVIWH